VQGRNRAPQCSLQWWMLHRVDDGVDARRCYGAESREIVMEEDDSADHRHIYICGLPTNKLRTTNKLKHRTFRQLKLKKMKKTRGHISASSLPSNVKEATAICCVNCA